MIYPKYLYHNTMDPVRIIECERIKGSGVSEHRTGVSFSSKYGLTAHGPFKIVFKKSPWFEQCIKIQYKKGVFDYGYRNTMFKGEREWWSPEPIVFSIRDIVVIVIMPNTAGAKILGRSFSGKVRKLIVLCNEFKIKVTVDEMPDEKY